MEVETEDIDEKLLASVRSEPQLSASLSIPTEEVSPEQASTWIQSFLQRTLQFALDGIPPYYETIEARTARYLNGACGDKILAWEHACVRTTTWYSKMKRAIGESIPFIGAIAAIVNPIWYHLRAIAFIACLHEHDVRSDEVRGKILECLVTHPSSTVVEEVGKPAVAAGAIYTAGVVTTPVVSQAMTNMVATRAVTRSVTTVAQSFGQHGATGVLGTAGYMLGGGIGAGIFKEVGQKMGADQFTMRASKMVSDIILASPQITNHLITAAKATPSVAQSAQFATAVTVTTLGCVIAVPLNLFLAWLTDNSEQIHQQAKDIFAPSIPFAVNPDGDDFSMSRLDFGSLNVHTVPFELNPDGDDFNIDDYE
jgi:hypothetical protein